MINEQCDTHARHFFYFKRISWSAIFAGALIGTGICFLLNLFSVAIGLSIVRVTPEGMVSLAVGGYIGLLIGVIVAMFIAGFAAGHLGQPYCMKRNLGVVYGFTTWCMALVLMALLTAPIVRYVTSYSRFITNPTPTVFIHSQVLPTMSTNGDRTDVVVNSQAATNNLGYSTFLVFVLFFVGALSSCYGGHFGMTCKSCRDDCDPINKSSL